MDELKNYLNSLTTLEQELYAKRCNTSIGYLRKALSTKPQMDGALCLALDVESNGAVRKQLLRPDIWPELAEAA